MSIRLSKIAKELNVGVSTAVDFLSKKGYNVDDNDLNYKLSDEEENLLRTEFDKDQKQKDDAKKVTETRKKKVNGGSVEISGFGEPKKESKPFSIPLAEDQIPKIKSVGRIDLSDLNGKKQNPAPVNKSAENNAEPVDEKPVGIVSSLPEKKEPEVKAAPVETKVETPAFVPAANNDANNQSDGQNDNSDNAKPDVFAIPIDDKKPVVNVVGKIDLDTLNQRTRPPKKSKEERKKERELRNNKGSFNKGENGKNGIGGGDMSGDDDHRKKRKRIQKERVDISDFKGGNGEGKGNKNNGKNNNDNGNNGGDRGKKGFKKSIVKPEVDEEEVQKQIKETLARLTSKGQKTKGSKHRRDKREMQSLKMQEQEEQEKLEQSKLKITEFVTVSELATMMDVPVTQVISTCMNFGLMVSINQRLDAETINIVAEEFGFETEYVSAEVVAAIHEEKDDEADLVSRPPIVTVMGHVDHGKTSLLDYIRKTNVIAGEAGGITQHIGAYNVTLSSGQQITFLDTPGHEAFTAMRARGAKVTDIAIIIVAADDDVMPQTIEAINHASVAGVPIVFAINKVDKPTANPDKIKEALANMNYLVEEWGGKYQSQDISAKKGLGVKELMEKVLLEAELLDLKANPNRRAVGSIIESQLDKGRGYVSTVLVSNGTLRVGDIVVAGTNFGRIKAMFNERNQRIKEAKPSEPAVILGLNGAPQAGDNFNVFETEQEAREIANKREQLQREQGLRTTKHLTLEEIARRRALGNFQEMNIIVKADVDGSAEALKDSLEKLSTEEFAVNVIHKAVGQISESDVMLAATADAIIVGFQVRPSQAARRIAENEGVDIRLYSIIYDAIEQMKDAMVGMLSPEYKEEIVGTAEIQETFKISKVGTIAGCIVRDGKIKRGNKVRLIRDGIVVYTGELASLKRFKDDVKEVTTGFDCGLNIANYNDIQVGDLVESFEQVEVKRTL